MQQTRVHQEEGRRSLSMEIMIPTILIETLVPQKTLGNRCNIFSSAHHGGRHRSFVGSKGKGELEVVCGQKIGDDQHPGSDVRANRGPVTNNLPDSDTHPFEFPYNCSFRKEDYTEDDDYDCIYDTIICLSVTKWIHFNHGDGGIKRLFDKVYKSLAPGGCFVLEIQEWSSYKKKKSLTESFKKNVAAITLRPEHFQEYLVKNVGFASVKTLRVPAGASEGFHRPLLAFFK
ncbi:hypothetical protein GUITHDRAFT_115485 [Guillardia theta CCMP2712]|uniref:RNA methyltransferase n=1 Tax=Guillardia theta (strain CCMP2712) TaxID=905079 RepID=L1IR38_GUITC|nr:hypothetical protein GUITHDRAFT_115485 [Guillardia theta CCMP2712]EKX38339.1 hypothetical protein GUITHDRAFT_115485 [Guillardia theta CCMP2712]|eukprot:XP_005825319.1 hypothetical protein GUITHDRAFT_115485 [Guillardia theta CCMP2712]